MSLTQINKAGLDELALDHVFTIGASGSSAYTFQGEGLNGTVNNPTLYLTRGKTYRFENGSGGHPIRIQSTSGASGTAYNTGVTNNAGSGTVIVEVQHDAPDVLYYQCTSHAAMNGILYIAGALADGSVTTAKLADDSVNGDKIAANAVGLAALADNAVDTTSIGDNAVTTAKIADSAVSTAKIGINAVVTNKILDGAINNPKIANDADIAGSKLADNSISLAKLQHGTSSNDGKFLRANNGADPTFETISGTTINNNADNRVITGSGSANTLNAETNVHINSNKLGIGVTSPDVDIDIRSSNPGIQLVDTDNTSTYGNIDYAGDSLLFTSRGGSSSDGYIDFRGYDGSTIDTNMRITPDGKVGIGTTSPDCKLHISGTASGLNSRIRITDTSNSNHTYAAGADGNGSFQSTINNARHIIYTNGSMRGSWTANGLCFGTDTSSNNGLADYEIGTWTPSMNKAGTTGSADSQVHTRVGYYIKIGELLWISFYWYSSNLSFGSGNSTWYIQGLPYNILHNQNSAYQFIPGGYLYNNGTVSAYNYGSYRWQSNNVNGADSLTMYGTNMSTNASGGQWEWSGTGVLRTT